jgi:hypothetical protein
VRRRSRAQGHSRATDLLREMIGFTATRRRHGAICSPCSHAGPPGVAAFFGPVTLVWFIAIAIAGRREFDLRHTLFLQLLYPVVVIIRDCRGERHRSGHSDLS